MSLRQPCLPLTSHSLLHTCQPLQRRSSLLSFHRLPGCSWGRYSRAVQQPCRGASGAASTAEAEPATRGRRRGEPKEVPAWVPWDQQAQQQQAASLAELQV
jgi:hypothetical protein